MKIKLFLLTSLVLAANLSTSFALSRPHLTKGAIKNSVRVKKALGTKTFKVMLMDRQNDEALFLAASKGCAAMVTAYIKPSHPGRPIPMARGGNHLLDPGVVEPPIYLPRPRKPRVIVHVNEVMCHSIDAGAFPGSPGEDEVVPMEEIPEFDGSSGVSSIDLD